MNSCVISNEDRPFLYRRKYDLKRKQPMGQINEIIDYPNRLLHVNNRLFKTQMECYDIYSLQIIKRLVLGNFECNNQL